MAARIATDTVAGDQAHILNCRNGAERATGNGTLHFQSPSPGNYFFQQGTHAKPPQPSPPTGDNLFNYMSLWRTFSFKSPQAIITPKHGAISSTLSCFFFFFFNLYHKNILLYPGFFLLVPLPKRTKVLHSQAYLPTSRHIPIPRNFLPNQGNCRPQGVHSPAGLSSQSSQHVSEQTSGPREPECLFAEGN